MAQRWEYRVHTIPVISSDEADSRNLTNIARPAMHERESADDWEIFAVLPAHSGVRLYMKRSAAG